MPADRIGRRRRARRTAAAALLVLALGAAAACGAGAGGRPAPTAEPTVQRIMRPGGTYDIEDFRGAGLKANKPYDVTGLPHGVEAWHGVFGGKEFEVRFYTSHEEAVEHGQAPAGHVTGKDGVVSGPDVLWEEGAADRRKCVPRAGLSEHGCLQTARYGDYVIAGNAVVLCEGPDSATALEACAELLANLE